MREFIKKAIIIILLFGHSKASNLVIVGITGASASGKTTFARGVSEEYSSYDITLIGEDRYYRDNSHLQEEERAKVNFDHPDALDHDLLYEHIIQLGNGESIEVPSYDFSTHTRLEETFLVKPSHVVILEGILIFSDERIRDLIDLKIYMDTPLDICLARRIKRDTEERGRTAESVLEQYLTTVRPMYLEHIKPTKRFADIIIPYEGNRFASQAAVSLAILGMI